MSTIQKPSSISHDHDDYIREHYLTVPKQEIARKIGRSDTYVSHRCKVLGLVIPKEILDQRKLAGQFRAGLIPHNKGQKMPDEIKKKVSRTWFKKGSLPHNTKYDGHVSVRRDKSGTLYRHVRVSLGKYVHEHVLIWEQHHGPLPENHVVYHIDGNSLNNDISNLAIRNRAEHLKANIGMDTLTDEYIALVLSRNNPELRQHIIQHKDLIELKRNQLKLKQQWKKITK